MGGTQTAFDRCVALFTPPNSPGQRRPGEVISNPLASFEVQSIMTIYDTREGVRIGMNDRNVGHWNRWGPFLAERAWGTVREDYSAGGDAWGYFPHDHARARTYRWNADGIRGRTMPGNSCDWSPDSKELAYSKQDGSILRVDANT